MDRTLLHTRALIQVHRYQVLPQDVYWMGACCVVRDRMLA